MKSGPHEFMNLRSGKSLRKDLSKSRIEKDLKRCTGNHGITKRSFVHLLEEKGLIFLSSGVVPTTDIKDDLRNAY